MLSYNPRLNPVFGQMYRLSIVFLLHLEVSLRMQTSRTHLRSFLACVDETAVTALPYHFAFLGENRSGFDVLDKSTVAFFVSFFSNGNITVHGGYFGEAFLLGNIGICGGGINALVARYYGARDRQELQRTVHSSAIICLICGILLLIFGFFGSRPLLRLLNGSEGIFVEPSAAISAAAYMGMMGESCTDYLKKHGLDEKMSRAAHILWATGGGLVPKTERNELCGTGAKR